MRSDESRELYARRLYCVTATGRAPSRSSWLARSASPWSGCGSAASPRRNARATSIGTPNRSLSDVSCSSSLNSIHAVPGVITSRGRVRWYSRIRSCMAEPFWAARKIDHDTVSQYVVVDHWYGRSSRESGRLFAVVRMTRRAMLSLTWKRCSWRRSASASCAGAVGVVTFVLTLLGRIGRHREYAAPGERDTHSMLHIRGDDPVERAQELFRDRFMLGLEDLRGTESHVGIDGADVLEDAPAEEPHQVPRVV